MDVSFIVHSETFHRTGFCKVSVHFAGFELDNTPEDVEEQLLDLCSDRKWKTARHAILVAARSKRLTAATPRREFDPDARRRILADQHIPRADRKALRAYFKDEC